ncbi:coenzyme PQQ biosynthesis protein C [Hydrogenobacter thermophilus TK-6]|uniref:pyrroloquinoline-quinone synthase PqqC n=1 Tax=Hydrogenobacter thermophilus TaxID=940 RepID=UPI0001E6569C|nr:pyrroloquinoline-quinone synthase PqqC [Hydrogenobacter thermophilus]ADO45592.1 coenzyme PQQ biosynthesis protein C [Hydrogenobacter thermophilus TK-6]
MSSSDTFQDFVEVLKLEGYKRYHIHHPFHRLMVEGKLTPGQIRAWVVNRFYYQRILPMKDAAIISNCPFPEVRRIWIKRILNHDNYGIEMWIKLGEAVGLSRSDLLEGAVLPGVKLACDAYLDFCKNRSWLEGIASSLTTLVAPNAHMERLEHMRKHYEWIKPNGFEYFEWRLKEGPEDSHMALNILKEYIKTEDEKERCIEALIFKTAVLWNMLDALYMEYVINGRRDYE